MRPTEDASGKVLPTAASAGVNTHGAIQARYETIKQVLRDSILRGSMPLGLVLIEGPIASLFGTSRGPVHKAMELLYKEGLIRRFKGRGFVVSPNGAQVEPKRLPLNEETLGIEASRELVDNRWSSERIFSHMEDTLSECMIFGHFKLLEETAAEYYGVSRSTVREALIRLRDRGLLERDPYSQWLAGPLTARSVSEDYHFRRILEPAALLESAPLLDHAELNAMLETIDSALNLVEEVGLARLDQIHTDLHVRCLRHCKNRKILAAINQSQMPFMIHRIFFATLRTRPEVPMFKEHRIVIEFLVQGAFEAAAAALEAHLRKGADRILQRLKALSLLPQPELPDYLVRIA